MTTTIGRIAEGRGKPVFLKTDTLGRVRMPVEKREALLERFEKSGMSGACFAKWAGINYQTFASWRQKRAKKRDQAGQASRIEWVEAEVEQPETKAFNQVELSIHLPGGARMEVSGIGQVPLAVEVIRHLGATC
jgi:hypothetical protein